MLTQLVPSQNLSVLIYPLEPGEEPTWKGVSEAHTPISSP